MLKERNCVSLCIIYSGVAGRILVENSKRSLYVDWRKIE